ncbi:phage DNA replication protein (predicted replicative helicase loader) [Yokenella regensburgei]|uniref:Phage DNA replication protein (Predicted replicative helicase loader) n=1 Tax=Yokenella regensburgei TaxID=158877 RepID=A0ABX9S2V1_9ENTR|nr:ATP-binding protein [Yokenella regensburgei]RKR64989.1 phage DNA replication protein (predicted replicative helicase loader) [Yokenella regensburgei]VFS14524.1 DNA replication protein dnaC [Yokenella regensburgei]
MKSTIDLFSRLQKLMPPGVQPRFNNAAELMEWQRTEGMKRAEEVEKENRLTRSQKILGRSGICDLHRNCTFASYQVGNDGQKQALSLAKSYAHNFGSGFASFVFSGGCGTGKNHLAAAVGNYLLQQGHSVLVVTVPDLMLRIRECYDGGKSEAALLDDLCRVDLLVLDEVGVQRETRGEWVLLNQIIDRRLAALKPVGVLTNLNHQELTKTLGERVMDRLTMDGGIWVNFTWGSYRKNVTHLRVVK